MIDGKLLRMRRIFIDFCKKSGKLSFGMFVSIILDPQETEVSHTITMLLIA